MKKIYFITTLFLVSNFLFATTNNSTCGISTVCQNTFDFQKINTGFIKIKDTFIDDDGNTYNVGRFSNTVDLDPNPSNIASFSSSGGFDSFLQKLDSAGNYVWAKTWGGSNSNLAEGVSIDSAGNIYIVGNFIGSADFDPSAAVFSISSSEAQLTEFDYYYTLIYTYEPTYDGYVLKLDSAGNFLWVNKFGSAYTVFSYYNSFITFAAGNGDVVSDIEIDENDNIIIAGTYEGTNNFNGIVLYAFTSSYGYAANATYIAKIDASNGNAIWANGITSGNVSDLEIDAASNIVIAQSVFIYDYNYYTGYNSFSESDYELKKFDANGQSIWNYYTDDIAFKNIAVDDCNNVFAVGSFSGTDDFNNDPVSDFILNSINGNQFVLKLNSAGEFEIANQIDASNVFIDLDADGNVYVANQLSNTSYQTNKYSNDLNAIWTISSTISSNYSLIDINLNNQNDIITSAENSNRWYENPCELISNCPSELNLNNQVNAATYQADDKIFSDGKIDVNSGGSVIYQAGDEFIELQTGFEADGTVNFTAEILDCDLTN